MGDPERGTVWEESVINCPNYIRLLALSATVGNVEDIQGWINSIHGNTVLIKSDFRPVPLQYYFAVKNDIIPLFKLAKSRPRSIDNVDLPSTPINPLLIQMQANEEKKKKAMKMKNDNSKTRKFFIDRLVPK